MSCGDGTFGGAFGLGRYMCGTCGVSRDLRPWPKMAFVVVRAGKNLTWLPLCPTCGRIASGMITTDDLGLGPPSVITKDLWATGCGCPNSRGFRH